MGDQAQQNRTDQSDWIGPSDQLALSVPYATWLSHADSAVVANALICLIHQAPTCPLCGKPMRKRTARQGSHAGQFFWGCTAYPDCKGILPSE